MRRQPESPRLRKRRRERGYPTVKEIRTTAPRGPWTTKSGSLLTVLLAHPHNARQRILDVHGEPFADAFVTASGFLAHHWRDVQGIPDDLRGLRAYLNTGMPKGKVGGLEYHQLRQEFIVCLTGRIRWTFEDLYGGILHMTHTPNHGVYFPPWILHTYEAEEDASGVLVLCNTLFTERCTDTYSVEEFRALQERVRQTGKAK